ncbi:MAG: enoyl-CoA hydratase/isomerase family protein [Syntrophales bacterium]|jgi:enoyl-CoA hydratase/carnithine racemase|nr:enoyl-CoA hydratase/isomerase family protein [Syntrophales bacterium]HOG06896.1 enoyl-CoA hydratase/isomerase family protein [Syntrophales bacterium]HQN24855.1 enoyl-CoA hydratase/isomerase family protein [Syntrophales bacterium]HQP27698.1 enoyl-CoA hydratase/isomerase family protein [Syntrophales bacterium]
MVECSSLDYKTILVDIKNGYAVVTLNRPQEMNALSKEMRLEIEACFKALENDPRVNCVVLTGGDYVFSAGMDIKELSTLADTEIDDFFRSVVRYLKRIYVFPRPVIAAVGGIALGGGFNLAAVCDIIIASESAIFGHPELKFGVSPLFNPLRQRVGMAKAKEVTMLGEPIGAREALRIGLVNKVATPESFMREALNMAEEFTKRSANALEAIKKISHMVPLMDGASALELEFDVAALLFSRGERKVYMQTFLERLSERKKK